MPDHSTTTTIDTRPARSVESTHSLNIAQRLSESAEQYPASRAVAAFAGEDRFGRSMYTQMTFRQLDEESDRLARGLTRMGVVKGTRMVLMVRPGLEFIALTFALFKAGAVVVLIDPGMGRANVFQCLKEVEPEGFVALPVVHAVRRLNWFRFPGARLNVSVGASLGGKLLHGSVSYARLLGEEWTPFETVATDASDPAAIIFTSGSTGPPKGVLYEHGMFDAQVHLLRDFYDIQPGEVDLSGFPLFALFNSAMGVTTVIPDMDATQPAQVDPARIVEAIRDQGVTQAFGSPAIWSRVGRYCEERGISIGSLTRILSAGAPVPPHVLRRMTAALESEDGDMHTPYGATESLPVASIAASEVLEETAAESRRGAGTCVGRPFPQVQLKIVEITDGPISRIDDVRELPVGEIGEILVQSPSTTREYFRRPQATQAAKIPDGERFWHRMGDVGYLDSHGRLWFCGRKTHMVHTDNGPLFSVPCEAIFNEHPHVERCALVGVGVKPHQLPVVVVEPEADHLPHNKTEQEQWESELRELALSNPLTKMIESFLFHSSLPVDVRHNAKIFREKLAPWAATRLKSRTAELASRD